MFFIAFCTFRGTTCDYGTVMNIVKCREIIPYIRMEGVFRSRHYPQAIPLRMHQAITNMNT